MITFQCKVIATTFATFVKKHGLAAPYGGTLDLIKDRGAPHYSIPFSKNLILDGSINIKCVGGLHHVVITIEYATNIIGLPPEGARVFLNMWNALRFLQLAFVDGNFVEAMRVPSRPGVVEQPQ